MEEVVKNSIITALRKEFDEPTTSNFRCLEILETVKRLGFRDTYDEMYSDLHCQGVVGEDNWFKKNEKHLG